MTRLLKNEYLVTEPCGCGITLVDAHKAQRDGVVLCEKHAAAPDLLEALRELVNSPNAKENAAWDRARAAIAKAEGR